MWILPSLGRPEKLQDLADKIPQSHIFVYLHKGDERLEDYMSHQYPPGWTINVGMRRNLCDTLNWFVDRFPNASNYGLMADDVIPSPSDWQIQLETAAGHNFLAYPDDGLHGEALCPHHCIGGDLMRRVGYWAVPGLKHSFLDTAWHNMAASVGALRYLSYILFDHQHPYAGKGEMDETYALGQKSYNDDMKVFKEWHYDGFAEAVNRINAD